MRKDKYLTDENEQIIREILSFPEETAQGLDGIHEKIFRQINRAGEDTLEVSQ